MRRPKTRTLTVAATVLAMAAALAPTQSASARSLLGDPKGETSNKDTTYDVRRGAAATVAASPPRRTQ